MFKFLYTVTSKKSATKIIIVLKPTGTYQHQQWNRLLYNMLSF